MSNSKYFKELEIEQTSSIKAIQWSHIGYKCMCKIQSMPSHDLC